MTKEHTTIELYIIEAVRKRRLELNINPSKLSLEIGVVRNFVGCVENLITGYKYNSNHLNELAKVLKCRIADFYPDKYVEEDCLEEYRSIREARAKKAKAKK